MKRPSLEDMYLEIINLQSQITSLHEAIFTTNLALGRIIAKLDPTYNQTNDDQYTCTLNEHHQPISTPTKLRAESDAIAKAIIARLLAEHKASNPGT